MLNIAHDTEEQGIVYFLFSDTEIVYEEILLKACPKINKKLLLIEHPIYC